VTELEGTSQYCFSQPYITASVAEMMPANRIIEETVTYSDNASRDGGLALNAPYSPVNVNSGKGSPGHHGTPTDADEADDVGLDNLFVTGKTAAADELSDDDECVEMKISSDKNMLAREQASDETLAEYRRMAGRRQGEFEWREGLLYHVDHVLGQRVEQLVLPKCRRSDVLKLAHD
jgi:hypothetical protein